MSRQHTICCAFRPHFPGISLPRDASQEHQAQINKKPLTERAVSKKNTTPSTQPTSGNEADLGSRYGEIGISALAAALKYKSENKNPAYAPASPSSDKWPADAAA